jgi:tetratricopeptide (TPR) repeat protein
MNIAKILVPTIAFFLVLIFWTLWKIRFARKGFKQFQEKDYAGAIKTFKKVLRQNRPHLNNYVNLSAALIGAERHAEALQVLDDAIAAGVILPPAEIETADLLEATYLSNRGVALGKLNQYDEALNCLEASLRNMPIENPMYPWFLLNYARVYARQGQKPTVMRVLEEIDRWFEMHEIPNPEQVEMFKDERAQVMALLDEL